MQYKFCKRCEQEKPISDYRADPRYKDGYGSWCMPCHRERNSSWARENRARLTQKARQWRNVNETAWRETYRSFHNRNKTKRAQQNAEWSKNNRALRRASYTKHKTAKLRAMPVWADEMVIKGIYRRAVALEKATGVRMHVDHIVPLQHPLVCGLHVPWNLQVIPGAINESKRNKWPFSIEAAYAQPDLFVPQPAAKPEQLTMDVTA